MTRVKATNMRTGLVIPFKTLREFRNALKRWRDLEEWFFKVVK